ncbi:hypothetical protein NDK43_13895 [Neobacillus pocheonensis]|uniref:CopG family transcriptional regulator n=1 Tax=Neobacillus pocheonensis TaxID=363869 RepID=A0ABT0WCH1_9BACI|nr:hypothetical protein [Neobacillus pocheonensis]
MEKFITIRMSKAEFDQFTRLCNKVDKNKSAVVRRLIKSWTQKQLMKG